ncbi:hypothetical protein PVAP13_9KG312939 [Panicum virgatum]|uniref:Uncharacterized protein n=1 Tax=Panicum virgatum TaxID=38727 RepID=A0A8T0NN58_PANVG|nr:hypothetical protein PVAP13_9KG312939 [Panicum virgatum]
MFSSLPKEQSFERIINAGTKHWLLFINKILVLQITYLLNHLIQLSKTGFSKATQRLDGIYAFFAVLRFSAVDSKADGTVLEKLWPLIAQNEPSLISLQLLPKLADDDCLAALDLLHSFLVEHLFRAQEYFSIQASLQVLIYLACHPNWEVRKVAYDATKKVLSSSSDLAEDTLYLFTDWFFISWRETVNVETRVFTCRPIDIKC